MTRARWSWTSPTPWAGLALTGWSLPPIPRRRRRLVAGDDEEAKATVARLVESAGMRPIDAGPMRRAQQLEHLGFLHMAVQDKLGSGYSSAVKFLSP